MNSAVTVSTESGDVSGLLDPSSGISAFLGIPYAEPPIGSLRFRPPVPVQKWSGVRDASRFGSASAHIHDVHEGSREEFGESTSDREKNYIGEEDSLTLNIWSRLAQRPTQPVVVFIHGGANWVGTSRLPVYHGDQFVNHGDVVFVSMNYRLGSLGFLELGELGGEEFVGSANNGLKDQLTALHWIHRNIAAFGGDASNITLVGQSAGSIDISWLLAGGHLDDCVRRVVLMSGVGGNKLRHDYSLEGGNRVARKFLRFAEIESIEHYQRLTTAELIERHRRAFQHMHVFEQSMFSPRIDGEFLKDSPIGYAAKGKAANIDVLIGHTGYEMGLYLLYDPTLDDKDYKTHFRNLKLGSSYKTELASLYDDVYESETVGVRAMQLLSDIWYVMPTLLLAEHLSKFSNRVWVYDFSWAPDGSPCRSAHAFDLFFWFNKTNTAHGQKLVGTPRSKKAARQMQELSMQMQASLLSFASVGDPDIGLGGSGLWAAYNNIERPTAILDTKIATRLDPRVKTRTWWAGNQDLIWSAQDAVEQQ